MPTFSQVALELYLAFFPRFVAQFLGIFAGTLALLILLIFFYYFAVILFLGAEVNAYIKGVREMPYDLVTLVHLVTSHRVAIEPAAQQGSAASQQDEAPPARVPMHERTRKKAAGAAHNRQARATGGTGKP